MLIARQLRFGVLIALAATLAAADPGVGMMPRTGKRASCGTNRAAVDEHGFGHIALGHAVSDWFPVDVDSDGVWELAVRSIVGSLHNVGVFDPKSGQWIDGPRAILGDVQEWGAGDYDRDGTVEYAYRRADTIRLLDPTNGADSALWTALFTPASAVFWGQGSQGEPLVGINEYVYHDAFLGWAFGKELHEGYEKWTLHVRDLWSGQEIAQVPAGPSRFIFCDGDPAATHTTLIIHQHQYKWHDFMMGGERTLIDTVHLYDVSWSRVLAVPIQYWTTNMGGPPDPYYLVHFAMAPSSACASGEVVVDAEAYRGLMPSKLLCRDSSASALLWSVSHGTGGYYTPFYHDFVAYDLGDDGSCQWLMPLRQDLGWEIREPSSGTILDTIENMPSVDLQVAPLFVPGHRELFYIADSTLYVWMPDAYTAVGGDESGPVPGAELALHAAPNPFNSAVHLFWSGAVEPSRLEIFNILGQRVWAFNLSAAVPPSDVLWDGTDAGGRSVPSGVYFARLVERSRSATVKIVMLK